MIIGPDCPCDGVSCVTSPCEDEPGCDRLLACVAVVWALVIRADFLYHTRLYVSACLGCFSAVPISSKNQNVNTMIEIYLESTRSVYLSDIGREVLLDLHCSLFAILPTSTH